MGFGDWGSFLSKVMDKLPILTPVQRRRANIAKLKQEIKDIQARPWTPALGELVLIKQRQLDKLLQDAANA